MRLLTICQAPQSHAERKSSEEKIQILISTAGFSALAFKIATDPFVGQLVFARIYTGKLSAGATILNSSKNQKERIGRMLEMLQY